MQKGYSVDTVKDGYKVLGYLMKKRPQIIILDLMMPDKDGLTIFSTIKDLSPLTKIIIYTGFNEYEHSVAAKQADRFLLKEGKLDNLLKTVDELA